MPHVRTAGGHRRFNPEALRRWLAEQPGRGSRLRRPAQRGAGRPRPGGRAGPARARRQRGRGRRRPGGRAGRGRLPPPVPTSGARWSGTGWRSSPRASRWAPWPTRWSGPRPTATRTASPAPRPTCDPGRQPRPGAGHRPRPDHPRAHPGRRRPGPGAGRRRPAHRDHRLGLGRRPGRARHARASAAPRASPGRRGRPRAARPPSRRAARRPWRAAGRAPRRARRRGRPAGAPGAGRSPARARPRGGAARPGRQPRSQAHGQARHGRPFAHPAHARPPRRRPRYPASRIRHTSVALPARPAREPCGAAGILALAGAGPALRRPRPARGTPTMPGGTAISPYEIMIILNPEADESRQEEILERVQQLIAAGGGDGRPRRRLGPQEDLVPDAEAARGRYVVVTCTRRARLAGRDRARHRHQQGRRAARAAHPAEPGPGGASPPTGAPAPVDARPEGEARSRRGGRGGGVAAAPAAGPPPRPEEPSVPADLNRVTLVGRLTRDPELRHTAGGDAVCSIRLAVSSRVARRLRQLGRPVQLLRRDRLRPPGRDGQHVPGQGPAHRRRRPPVAGASGRPRTARSARTSRSSPTTSSSSTAARAAAGERRRRRAGARRRRPRRRSDLPVDRRTCSRPRRRPATTTSPSRARRGFRAGDPSERGRGAGRGRDGGQRRRGYLRNYLLPRGSPRSPRRRASPRSSAARRSAARPRCAPWSSPRSSRSSSAARS